MYLNTYEKEENYTKSFNDNLMNMRKTWEGINDILLCNGKNSKHVQFMNDPKDSYWISSNLRRIVTVPKEYFSSMGPKLENKLHPIQHNYFDFFLNVSDTPINSFALDLVIPEEIKK